MNNICSRCLERWDLDTYLHDDPEEFQVVENGCLIIRCPACSHLPKVELTPSQERQAETIKMLASMLSEDVDGFVSTLDEHDYFEEEGDDCFEEESDE